MIYKSKTGTSGLTTAQAITITSPNTKMIFLKQYVVACYGTDGPQAAVTIQVTDEDTNGRCNYDGSSNCKHWSISGRPYISGTRVILPNRKEYDSYSK